MTEFGKQTKEINILRACDNHLTKSEKEDE